MSAPLNLIGVRFDKLLVTGLLEGTPSGRRWACVCDCGESCEKITTQLRRATRRFGGCRRCETEARRKVHVTHGRARRARLYDTWKGMRQRCADQANPYYGGKGIRLCATWNDYSVFEAWALAHGYDDTLVIERRDASKNYEPANCEWITKSENSRRAAATRKVRA